MGDKGTYHEDSQDGVVGEGGGGTVLHVGVEYFPEKEYQSNHIRS